MNGLAQTAYFLQLAAIPAGATFILHIAGHTSRPRWPSILAAIGCAALAVLTFRISDPSYLFWDFHSAYYPAGQAVLAGAQQLREMTGLGVSGFVNMPVIAYIFAPFALLPERAAANLFLMLSLASVAATWLMLAGIARLGTADRWLLLLVFAANGPLIYSLKEGNTSHFVLLALVAALAMLRSGRAGTAGALLGAAAMVKPPLLLFGVFFVLRRDLRGTIDFCAVCGAVVLLSLALFGRSDNWHWFQACIVQFSHHWLAAFNVQSIPAFLFRLVAPASSLQDWNASLPPAGFATLADVAFALLFGLAAIALWRGAQASKAALPALELQYSLAVCLVILASPLSWSHYYCWLLLPTALFLGWRRRLPRRSRICGWLAILLVTPVIRMLHFASPWMLHVYKDAGVSHLLVGGLLWFGLIVWWLSRPIIPSTSLDKP
jgi:hypothetical protein